MPKKVTINNNFPLTNPVKVPVTNVLYVVDRSGSMRPYWDEVKRQMVGNINHLKAEAERAKQEIRVTVVTFSYSAYTIIRDQLVSSLDAESVARGLGSPGGCTALWASVSSGVETITAAANLRASFSDNAFLVNILTDGENTEYPSTFQESILARHEKWTFTAACPPGSARRFRAAGFDADNVVEWEASNKGAQEYGDKTRSGISQYMTARSQGLTKSSSFYVDASAVNTDLLEEVSGRPVEVKTETTVREFAEQKTGKPYVLGSLFYRLEKPEKLQDHKQILLWHKKDKKLYGDNGRTKVRGVLGLSSSGEIRINPGNHGDFDIFVQSGSVNRKLPSYTKVILVTP